MSDGVAAERHAVSGAPHWGSFGMLRLVFASLVIGRDRGAGLIRDRDSAPAPGIAAPTAPTARPHLAYLDGLRGVAILMVVMIHTSQLVPGLPGPIRDAAFYGVRGVQLFFIVSGLTLTLNYAGKPFRPLNFAARRYFRIAPMFYVGVVLYLVLVWTTPAPFPTRDAGVGDVVATLLFLHGWVPSAINAVVPGGWSIAAEAMFYVCFPALLLLVPRRRAMTAVLIASYALAGIANLLLRRLLPGPAGAEMALYFWVVQFPAFVGGCWLATRAQVGAQAGTLLRRIARAALALAFVGMIVDSQLRGRSNLLVAVALLTIFAWAAIVVRPRWLENAALTLIGRVSFSLYILHFAIIAALRPWVPTIAATLGAVATFAVVFAGVLAVAGSLAWCAYRWIEVPAVRATRRIGLPRTIG